MSSPLENILPKMAATHAKLVAYVAGLDAQARQQKASAATWDPRTIVGHLVDSERAHRRFIEAVAGDIPPARLENFDLDAWNAARAAKRAAQPLEELLALLEQERQTTIAVLQGLPDDAWEKRGEHAALGNVTVLFVARVIGLHERAHLQEMQEISG